MPPVTPSSSSTPSTPGTSGTKRVDLQYPVTVDGIETKHLDLRRLKVRDLLHAAKQGGSDEEKEVSQFASLAGVAPKVIEDLDMADYLAIQDVVKDFLS